MMVNTYIKLPLRATITPKSAKESVKFNIERGAFSGIHPSAGLRTGDNAVFRCALESDGKHDDLYVGTTGYKTPRPIMDS